MPCFCLIFFFITLVQTLNIVEYEHHELNALPSVTISFSRLLMPKMASHAILTDKRNATDFLCQRF